jgi:hypothetical protein
MWDEEVEDSTSESEGEEENGSIRKEADNLNQLDDRSTENKKGDGSKVEKDTVK